MYNKAKKLTSEIAGLVSLICGGLGILLAIISLVLTVVTGAYVNAEAFWLLGFVIKVGMGLLFVSMGIKGMTNPVKVEIGKDENDKKLFKWVYVSKLVNLALIALSVAMLILTVHAGDGMFGEWDYWFTGFIWYFANGAQLVMLALYAIVIVFNAVTLLISDNSVHNEDEYADEEIEEDLA